MTSIPGDESAATGWWIVASVISCSSVGSISSYQHRPRRAVFRPGTRPHRVCEPDRQCRVIHTLDRVAPLRVVVAEDQLLLREGLSRLLTDAGFDVVAQA